MCVCVCVCGRSDCESESVMSGVESDAEERSLTSLVAAKVLCMYMCVVVIERDERSRV